MTTEVLRNMLYAGSGTLAGLGYVVMDEVHYLADRFRGAVWEEVIIHLPESVALVSLSATVSNAEEFGDWLVDGARRHHGHRRGAPAGAALAARAGRTAGCTTCSSKTGCEGRLAPRSTPSWSGSSRDAGPVRPVSGRSARPRGGRRVRGVRARQPGRRCIERLDAEGLLPAITFIFSRAGCDAAVAQCLHGPGCGCSPRRTGPRSARSSRSAARDIPPEDLHVLGYHEWLDGLERGLAAHHAGMLPTFKEVVEELFVARPGQGGLRHRDPRAGHQHAGPLGGARAAGQVERREPRRRHAGGVHPAHRPGRPARHRRRGPRRRGCGSRVWTLGAGRAGVAPAPTRCAPASGRRTTWRSTWSARSAGSGPGPCWSRRSPSSRPTGPWSAWPGRCAAQRGGPGGLPRGDDLPPRRLRGVRRAAPDDRRTARRSCRAAARPTGGRRRRASLEALRPGDVIRVPAGRRAGLAVVLDPGTVGGADGPRPTVLTAERQVTPAVAGRLPGPGRAAATGCASRRRSTRAARPAGATWPPRCATPGWPNPPPGRGRRPSVGGSRRRGAAAAARPSCGRIPATAATSARTTPAGPSATTG